MHRPHLPVHDPTEYHRNHCADKGSRQGRTYNGSRIHASVLAPVHNHVHGYKLQGGYVDNEKCTHLIAGSPRLSGRSSLPGRIFLSWRIFLPGRASLSALLLHLFQLLHGL